MSCLEGHVGLQSVSAQTLKIFYVVWENLHKASVLVARLNND